MRRTSDSDSSHTEGLTARSFRVEVVVEHAETMLSPMTVMPMFYVHGDASRVDPQATAFGLRGECWEFDIISQWTDPAESAVHVQWTRQ